MNNNENSIYRVLGRRYYYQGLSVYKNGRELYTREYSITEIKGLLEG